jgi:RimJ/RimL family protein N-acetyltransferase
MLMTSTPRLQGSRVLLRELRDSDRVARQQLGRDPEIARNWGQVVPGVSTLTDAEAQDWYQANIDKANPYFWIIEHEQRMVGTAHLHALDFCDLRARYAISILDATLLGHGLGGETTELVLKFAFTALGLHRVDLRVLDFNARAIACYRKCGFVVEGRERETALIDGVWYDDVIMSVLEHEYGGEVR